MGQRMTTRTDQRTVSSVPTRLMAARVAPCRTHDAELWFAATPESVARAQRLCGGCPLRAPCLAGAVERREPWGVWGGELFKHGVPVARKRGPGRPRKEDELDQRTAERALVGRLARSGIDLGGGGVAA